MKMPALVLLFAFSCLFQLSCNPALTHAPKQKLSENRILRRRGKQVYKLFSEHRLAEAVPSYLNAAGEATRMGEHKWAAKFLINAGGCQLMIFRYQDALPTMERARKAAELTGDSDFVATANANIASLYLQMGNLTSAAVAGERALSVLRESHPQYSRAIIPLAQVRAEQHDLAKAEVLIFRAIDGAYRANDPDTVAWAWDYLGYRYSQEHRLAEADTALSESLRIRKMFHLSDLGSSYYHLARVRSDQGQNRAASALLNSAIQELKTPGNVTPAWNIYFEWGRLLTKEGDQEGAFAALGKAVNLARAWRAEVVANDANRTSTELALAELYSLYIEVGNRFAASRGLSLARETFQAVEENRAASLRALAERETGWHTKLPAEYWQVLAKLQSSERDLFQQDSDENRAAVAHFRSSLDEMEAASGAPQTFTVEPAAIATQKKLDADTVLLSFQLGERSSWLWAVTQDNVSVFSLPPRTELIGRIHEFQSSVRRGAPQADDLGAELYRLLFSSLPENLSNKERWIFSLDQELFALPMPALVVRFANSNPIYLGALHALEATPGALMYAASKSSQDFQGPILGVGDAIYNRADPRWMSSANSGKKTRLSIREAGDDNFHFARLWGTADEIHSVAKTWTPPGSILLLGADASRNRLWQELGRKPAVIHFATHVLEANDQLRTGWIALSMGTDDRPDFLSPSDISARKLSAGLVVLNGCSSGAGEVRAASGLMGLTRAWIAAGASEVLATRWAGPDDAGIFFTSFYKNLKSSPEKGAAYALRSASRQSIETGGWRSKPQFWASYFLTGNY